MSADAARLSPEHFLSLIRRQQRGRLKVYLGFAAGVGKTYEMLQEGHRLRQQGGDVVGGGGGRSVSGSARRTAGARRRRSSRGCRRCRGGRSSTAASCSKRWTS